MTEKYPPHDDDHHEIISERAVRRSPPAQRPLQEVPTTVGVEPPTLGPAYLGDGVYASFDGYQVWLHLNSHDAPAIVAIDRDVFVALQIYCRRVYV